MGLMDAVSKLIKEVVAHFCSEEIRGEDNCEYETRDRENYLIILPHQQKPTNNP
jgi:hypothetical protein